MRLRRIPFRYPPISAPIFSRLSDILQAYCLHPAGTEQHPDCSCKHHQDKRRYTFHPASSLHPRMPLGQLLPACQCGQYDNECRGSSCNSNQPFENLHIFIPSFLLLSSNRFGGRVPTVITDNLIISPRRQQVNNHIYHRENHKGDDDAQSKQSGIFQGE